MDDTRWTTLADALHAASFPANRQDLINHVRQQPVDDGTVELIRKLPIGIYRNLVDVRDRIPGAAA